jgi:hypothetical protein
MFSQKNSMDLEFKPISPTKQRRHTASLQASVNAMYSASVEDNATVACHFDIQLIGPFPKLNT